MATDEHTLLKILDFVSLHADDVYLGGTLTLSTAVKRMSIPCLMSCYALRRFVKADQVLEVIANDEMPSVREQRVRQALFQICSSQYDHKKESSALTSILPFFLSCCCAIRRYSFSRSAKTQRPASCWNYLVHQQHGTSVEGDFWQSSQVTYMH